MDYNERQQMKETINLLCMILGLAALFIILLNFIGGH